MPRHGIARASYVLVLLSALLLPPLAVRADDTVSDESLAEEQRPRQVDVTEYSFEDDAVLGDTTQPGMEVLHARRRGGRESLVRARTQFVVELLHSVEQL